MKTQILIEIEDLQGARVAVGDLPPFYLDDWQLIWKPHGIEVDHEASVKSGGYAVQRQTPDFELHLTGKVRGFRSEQR